ncbi:CheR family methyltransferase [Nodosilinea nodulosa]|uniref:CheR family methyltransferase n=1 Tax=Nodosilinea nodulosa TaxID=416001 RepID=UPI000318F0F9|nr:CheR family methyltransferase [Nodosilinea nodulosa]
MDELILRRISSLIRCNSGMHIREQDYASLAEKVRHRANSLKLTSLADYHTYLLKELEQDTGSSTGIADGMSHRSEWQELYSILTINESYFFRDSNQFKLLTEQILPEIISREQANSSFKPRLRIWSAGCSTGEELYSIAIALDELNFPWDRWDALLIGTDISQAAIDSARQGNYSNWSFRQMPAALQQKYFSTHRQSHQICDRLQQRVVFQRGNLLNDPYPSLVSGLYDLDLILCRNVFIYLNSQAIGQIIAKFHQSLVPQGYFLSGHTELYSQDTSQFETLSFPESVVYKKQSQRELSPPIPKAAQATTISLFTPQRSPRSGRTKDLPQPSPSPKSRVASNPNHNLAKVLHEAEVLLAQKAYTSAIQQAETILKTYSQCDTARKIAARAYANIGQHEQAMRLCLDVIRVQPFSIDMYYLLAQIAEEKNDLETAKSYLKKIIYLDANFVDAYLDLASIYERQEQSERSRKVHDQALTLMASLPPR